MRFRKTPQFDDDLEKLPKHIQDQARKQFKLFKQDPQHPSLRIKKMQGYAELWKGHVTLSYVFTFHWDVGTDPTERTAVFRRIGTHEVYRNP